MGLLSTLDLPFLASWAVTTTLAAWAIRRAVHPRAQDGGTVPTLLAAGLLIAQAALYVGFTVDDSFISFRFARNWAEGLGPVFQAGPRVEGYTSFLWIALLALASRIGQDIEATSKVLGLASAVAILPAVAGLGRVLRTGARVATAAPLLLALSPLFAAWTLAGMDAPLFAAVLAWAAYRFVVELRVPSAFPVSALLFGLLVLVRPEGLLFGLVATATRSARDRGRWAALFATLVAPYWLARWAYFGEFFPNTFYAKTSLSVGRLVGGGVSVIDFAAYSGALLVLLVALALAAGRWRDAAERFVLASILAFLAYVVAVGGDVLHLRFYVHVLPLWIVAAALGLDRVLAAIGVANSTVSSRRVVWGTALAALIWTTLAFHEHARALYRPDQFGAAYVVDNARNIQRAHLPLGDWLRANAPAGARAAVTDIGGVGYRSRIAIIDLYGLTDRAIAHLIHRRASGDELVANLRLRRPELFVLYGSSKGAQFGGSPAQQAWFDSTYRGHSFWPDSPLDKGLVLAERRDLRLPKVSPPGVALTGP